MNKRRERERERERKAVETITVVFCLTRRDKMTRENERKIYSTLKGDDETTSFPD